MARDEQYRTTTTVDGKLRYSANVGNPPGPVGIRSHICTVCRLAFKEDKMTQYQGEWYGIPCGCHRDIPTLRRKGRLNRYRGRSNEEVHS
jgi:hypothetical protein